MYCITTNIFYTGSKFAKPTANKKSTTTITTTTSLSHIIILSQQFSHIIAFFSSTEFINFSINPILKDDNSAQKAQTNSTLHRTRIHTNLFSFFYHIHTHIIHTHIRFGYNPSYSSNLMILFSASLFFHSL